MTFTFKVKNDKSVAMKLTFDNDDKMNGRQGQLLVAQFLINSLGQ